MAKINILNRNYVPPYLINETFLDNRIGFWGTVCEVHPDTHRVDVIMDIGRRVDGIPVASDIWVKENPDTDVISGRRNLPPLGSFVFCLMPTHTVTGAFVLCSGIPYSDSFSSVFVCDKNNSEDMEDFPLVEKSTQLSGWVTEKRRDNGDVSFVSPTDDIHLTINHKKNNDEKDVVNLKVFGTTLQITNDSENGISINLGDDNNSMPITLSVKGDVSASVEGDISIENSNGDVNISSQGSITIEGSSGKVEIS